MQPPDGPPVAAEREHFGALALFGTHGGEIFCAFTDDGRNVGEGFHVVFRGRFAEQTLDRRIRRTRSGLAAVAFDGGHQRGLFTADERACAEFDVQIEIKAAAEDVLAEQAHLFCLLDRDLQTFDGDGILRTHIDVAFGRAGSITADRHRFDDAVRVAFQHAAVHERTRVAFVGVADHIFLIRLVRRRKAPFQARRETAAAAAAQTGILHDLNDLLRRHLGQALCKGLIAVIGDVLVLQKTYQGLGHGQANGLHASLLMK